MTQEGSASGFTNVDQTTDPGSRVQYLDTAGAMAQIQALKQRSFVLLEVKPGEHLLDIGCGTGDDVRALAQMVETIGRVVGVDNSETMIAEARKRAEALNLPVEYRVGDVQHLDFADNTFNGCRAERTIVHLPNPRQALVEMVRVTKPGGRVVILDPDFETLIIDAADRGLTRKFLNLLCDNVQNGWIGRQLWALFHDVGLTNIRVSADTVMLTDYAATNQLLRLWETAKRGQEAGVMSATEVTTWLDQLEKASQAGRFFAALTFFFVSGRKP